MNYMYVILEWNQASGRPRLFDDNLYHFEADALEDAEGERQAALAAGRHERYTVHEVDMDAVGGEA